MTTCIVLAAGQSKRFGAPKMLHTLANGQSILSSTVALYRALFDTVNVVTRPNDDHIIECALNAGAKIISSPNADLGMSQSLIAGIKALPDARRWLIALADMPYVSLDTLSLMLESAAEIVVPCYAERLGNPVIFSSRFEQSLLDLSGDRGGRSVIENNRASVELINFSDPGVLHDIDVLSDIKAD